MPLWPSRRISLKFSKGIAGLKLMKQLLKLSLEQFLVFVIISYIYEAFNPRLVYLGTAISKWMSRILPKRLCFKIPLWRSEKKILDASGETLHEIPRENAWEISGGIHGKICWGISGISK